MSRPVNATVFMLLSLSVFAQKPKAPEAPVVKHSWDNPKLSADERASLALAELTQEEKLSYIHGIRKDAVPGLVYDPEGTVSGVGYLPGVKRLGLPPIEMTDSAVGVRVPASQSRYATLLPSTLALASSWDPEAGAAYGKLIAHELRELGLNMSIGGGVNIMREPRNGRNFEYSGEDPLLAGTMVGGLEAAILAQHEMSDIKHFAVNDQETGRQVVNSVIDERAMRESDLLAFEIALEIAKPSAVMCSYNLVNGDHACENEYLLNKVLKNEWHFQGFVVSDWNGTHSTVKAAMAGLDVQMPDMQFFGKPFVEALAAGQIPQSRLDDMVHRVLRSMFASGILDDPPVREIPDPFAGRDVAQKIAEESIVLLRNERGVLPLKSQKIVLIGSHADTGIMSGGGSGQVSPVGGNAAVLRKGEPPRDFYFPSSPLRELRSHAPNADITYNDGVDHGAAAKAAKNADIAIVFVTQHMSEGHDVATLSLPNDQDALVEAIAAANPRTIIVIESGGPVTMPWKDKVAGIVEAWYPGIGGAQALANLLFGTVNFTAKLPASFPRTEKDLPHLTVPGMDRSPKDNARSGTVFDANYTEGARVGYKWYQSEKKEPLFPFGFGLSYTTFAYSGLSVDTAKSTATFTVKNTGAVAGTEIAQLYVQLPAKVGEAFRRLAGWQRVVLNPGESKAITVTMDKRLLSTFDVASQSWKLPSGEFHFFAGSDSETLPLQVAKTMR